MYVDAYLSPYLCVADFSRTDVIKERLDYLVAQMEAVKANKDVDDDVVLRKICDVRIHLWSCSIFPSNVCIPYYRNGNSKSRHATLSPVRCGPWLDTGMTPSSALLKQ